MGDPHVESVAYELKTGWIFDNPPDLDSETIVFKAKLKNGILRVEPRDHFATEEGARRAAEPFLLAWEIDVGITCGQRAITFEFSQSHIIDRDPPRAGSPLTVTGALTMSMSLSGTVQITSKMYPAPPAGFTADP